ncbi:hypothetical protein HPB50_001070 [Hyalomma asiaticum]|uniref:Uncharacterized protein n=1 Tax=Hyalomma asiaticum TaxID=266040 RepID=A0ACB7RLA2_HYAAI|nr:hypothetical protein HPB50_001070 [Hyalomma asiaticum]
MDDTKEHSKGKDSPERRASGSDQGVESAKEGSDEPVRPTGEDIQATQLSAGSGSSASANVEACADATIENKRGAMDSIICMRTPHWYSPPREYSVFHNALPAPAMLYYGEYSLLDDLLNERQRRFRAQWRTVQRMLYKIGARLSKPRATTDQETLPAIIAYRERRWKESQRKGRAVSVARERAAASPSRRSGSKPHSSDEVRSDAPTLLDGVFKRPLPVSKKPRREKAQPPAPRATIPSTASERRATVTSPERASSGLRSPRLSAQRRDDAEGILDKAREMFVDPQQYLYERECVILWLLRVHRCIERLRLDLTDIAESPDEFCRGWRLHWGYRVVELGVSGRISPSGHRLFSVLGHVTLLTELSLSGLYLMSPDDNVLLAALVTANMFLRKLSLTRCYMDARNLDGVVEATTGLPFFESFSISLQNPHSWVERGEQLSRLLASTGPSRLRRAQFGDGCHLKPLLKRLCQSTNVVEVQIAQELFSPSDLMTLCDVAEANTTLERLFLSIDMERAVPSRYYQSVLTRFVENANMDILKLDNSFFTTRGVRAVAEGLKRNCTVEMQRPDTEECSTLKKNAQQRCLRELYLRGDNLTCEHVSILVDALDGNRTLEILDVGYAKASAKVSDADVTQKIIDDAIRQYHRAVISQRNNPTAAARVNKVYFAEDIPLLISAIRKDVTFRKLILSFCDVPERTIQRQSSEFSRLLALLHFFSVRDTLEVLDVNVSSPGVSDVAFLGLSLLVATSKNLTELSIELADTCSDFASVLLFQGLASSTSVRSLIMSGWRLDHPVPLWFDHFCRVNASLRKLHIHVTCLEDEANTVFLTALPDTLANCAWLVDFRLTCGDLREPVFIPEVLSFLRVNKKLNPFAVRLVTHAARMPNIVVQHCDKKLSLYAGVTLRRAIELPDFKQALLESFTDSTDEIERAINKTKSLVSSALGRRAKIHRRLSVTGPTLNADEADRSEDMSQPVEPAARNGTSHRRSAQAEGKQHRSDVTQQARVRQRKEVPSLKSGVAPIFAEPKLPNISNVTMRGKRELPEKLEDLAYERLGDGTKGDRQKKIVSSSAPRPASMSSLTPFAPAMNHQSKSVAVEPITVGLFVDDSNVSWDFAPYSQSSRDSKPEPIGALPVSTQEYKLLEDLIYAMLGVDAIYIRSQPLQSPHAERTFTIDESADPSLKEMVKRILPLCSYHSTVRRFIEEKQGQTQGMVNQALAATMRDLLEDYIILVTQLEHKLVNQRALTLAKCWFYVQPSLTYMGTLATCAQAIWEEKCFGGKTLGALHKRATSLTGDTRAKDICLFLAKAASVPYFNMLESWVYRGRINDPFKEFLVGDKVQVKKEDMSIDTMDSYWNSRYALRPEMIPGFLEPLKDRIFTTGKYQNVIRQCGQSPAACSGEQHLRYSLDEREYIEKIDNVYHKASRALLNLLMDKVDLMGRLRSVKHFFLMDQGDFVVQFMDMAEEELGYNIDDIVPTRLELLLQLALSTSSVGNDRYKECVK